MVVFVYFILEVSEMLRVEEGGLELFERAAKSIASVEFRWCGSVSGV